MPVLDEAGWTARTQAHTAAVDALLADHLARRRAGRGHPVEDFLFTYYSYRPAALRRWHPGLGVVLAGNPPHVGWPGYEQTATGVAVRADAVDARLVTTVATLLAATAARTAHTGCFGLHEWAMSYRLEEDQQRHAAWPLRLGTAGTDAVVEAHHLRCTHYDAFRFFTPPARPRNAVQPTRAAQPRLEQPGCLHASMDLYKWAYRLSPATPSDLVLACFRLAREVRVLDMRASPYDLTPLGLAPVRIETAEGKAEYVAAQRRFADLAGPLRQRLLAVCAQLGAADSQPGASHPGASRSGASRSGASRSGDSRAGDSQSAPPDRPLLVPQAGARAGPLPVGPRSDQPRAPHGGDEARFVPVEPRLHTRS